MVLVYMLAAGLAVIAAGGWDEQRRRRVEARAELARARARHVHAPDITYREAHQRAHAAHRALLPHIPQQWTGGDR